MSTPPKPPWRFLYGPKMPGGGITAGIGQAVNRQITLRIGPTLNSQVSVMLDGAVSPAAAAITEMETDFIVLFGDMWVFRGRVGPAVDLIDSGMHTVVFTASDYRDVLRRQTLLPGDTLSYTSVDEQQIAWDLIQTAQGHTGGNLGITQGIGMSGVGVNQTVTFANGDYIGADIDNVAQLQGGFDWAINPYGEADIRFDCYATGGTNRGTVLALGQQRIQSIQRTVDPSTYADAVYYTGDSSVTLTPQALTASGIATAPQGRWDLAVGTNLLTQSSLNAAAAQGLALAEVLTPSYVITLQPGSWEGPDDIWIGDLVRVRLKSGRLVVDEVLQVVELDFAVDENNLEIATVTVGQIPLQISKIIPKILRNLAYLNTR